ncbi:MAG TPA: 23S rRNA (uracil(1939)-C(5))-methyltransferase RlmD [Limnochordia bacterium]|nr:23S rRNA (uracil(1939)-C(5))-methyltransferase RlmD [Limnochordia bacterium]
MNEATDLTIDGLGHDGEGVGRADGKAIFVPGALPGERVRVRLTEAHPRYARAELLAVLSPSPDRRQPPCPHFEACGGCRLQHLSEPAQAEAKRRQVEDALRRLGGFAIDVPSVLSGAHWGYRHKAQFPVQLVDGAPALGFFAPKSHRLVPITRCLVQDPLGQTIKGRLEEILVERAVPPYDEQRRTGWLRHVLIRTSRAEARSLVVLVACRATPPPHLELAGLAAEILRIPGVAGLFLNVNPARTNVILGPTWRRLGGAETLIERLDGLEFTISPASFFQVNPEMAAILYEQAVAAAELRAGDTCLDLYCGTGTIALFLARALAQLGGGRVLGVETVPQAVADARRNALRNGLAVEFWEADAQAAAARLAAERTRVDACVVDPPRRGCDEAVLERIADWRVRRFVYVSCNPATLARDLKRLQAHARAFRLLTVQPVDLFPETSHVEVVAAVDLQG